MRRIYGSWWHLYAVHPCSTQLRWSSSSSLATTPKNEKENLLFAIEQIAKSIKTHPESVNVLLDRMDRDARQTLATEFIKHLELDEVEDVEKEFRHADVGRDGFLSQKEFELWLLESFRRKRGTSMNELPISLLVKIAIVSGVPFVGFGFLDNAVMLLAGDLIDHTVGFYLHTSVMASAAMGGVVSGTVGMQVHGVLDRGFAQFGFEMPHLTVEQQKLRSVFLAGHLGGTLGIAFGLTLGMLPLLFLQPHKAH